MLPTIFDHYIYKKPQEIEAFFLKEGNLITSRINETLQSGREAVYLTYSFL